MFFLLTFTKNFFLLFVLIVHNTESVYKMKEFLNSQKLEKVRITTFIHKICLTAWRNFMGFFILFQIFVYKKD